MLKFSTSQDTWPTKNPTRSLSLLNTHQTHTNRIVHNLFHVCSNHTMFKLQKRGIPNTQFAVYISDISVTLKQSHSIKPQIMNPHSRDAEKNTSHENEVLPQATTHLIQRSCTHLIQRSCYQRRSPWQDPAGNPTRRRPPDHRKETQTEVVWTRLSLSGPAKTILQGTLKGGGRQGRQKKRWEDNIRECTGLEFARSQRAVQNREKWRKQVVESSVVPQRPSRLKDRW